MWAVSSQPESHDTSSDFAPCRGTVPRINLSLNLSHGKWIGDTTADANTEGVEIVEGNVPRIG
ncbi:hypothetical protein E4U40_000273, partial [Claviceps sp. LM458 group G5]